ncbi:MAG: hypothetical protein NT170_03665 [Candidatus Moranbacteria bacterium]|nr:hypothetical protein [Candidatus Moranbacteria bacterium]
MEKLQKKIYFDIFPGGEKQIVKEAEDVNHLVGDKYSKDQIRKAYFHMIFLFFIADDRSEERIIGSSKINMGDQITEEDTLIMYGYIKDRFLRHQLGTENSEALQGFSDVMFGGNIGYDSDEIPGGYGNFGYSITNPIPTKGINGSHVYLRKLKFLATGKEIKWGRTGSYSSDNIENKIDKYKLFDISGDDIATIYISPYHRKNSDKAPEGFELI